jgi:23S rRNA (cytidine1920-2'-O)/16S rRNA (cytidine1409-2'-O)-methyltransferase
MRLDLYLVENNFYPTRAISQEAIRDGRVSLFIKGSWKVVQKPSFIVEKTVEIKVQEEEIWVSRAAKKIQGAFNAFQLDLRGKNVLDIGQSTGGFTQFFLKQGASKVVGVDVGKDQLHESLRKDSRVECFEGTDARDLAFLAGREFHFFSADLSFISLLKVAPELKRVFGNRRIPGLFLVKPQFEVGRSNIGKGGIVKDREILISCEKMVLEGLENLGYKILDYVPAQVRGKDGNQEFICFVTT